MYDELPEEQRVERWNLDYFVRLGFDGDAVASLLEWRVDPHDAEELVVGRGCPPELALRILTPVSVPVLS
jgi:hypothetical protein